MEYFAHTEDCIIHREYKAYPNHVVVFHRDKGVLCKFGKHWTNEQIFEALHIANIAFTDGVSVGLRKAREIREALHID